MWNGLFDSDENIIARIKQGDDGVLKELYRKCYPSVAKNVRQNSGNEADAEDIFQNGIFVLWEKIVQDRLTLTVSICTYLFEVCKRLWLKELRRKSRFLQVKLPDDGEIPYPQGLTEDDEIELNKRQQIAQDCMSELGERCKSLLHSRYFDRLSMQEIALKVGLKNEDVAKNLISRCMRALRDCVKRRMSQAQ